MTPTTKRAPRFRELRLSLAALLAFASWFVLVSLFVTLPALIFLNIPVTRPMLIGAAGLVASLFLLYHMLIRSLRCQVCGCPVFGGGQGNRIHPKTRKFLGLSYSLQVAAEILSLEGFHCMHCQTFCRRQLQTEPLPAAPPESSPTALALPLFQMPSILRQEPVTSATGPFANLFNPSPAADSQPPSGFPLSTPQLIAPPERSPSSIPLVAAAPIHPEAMNTPPASTAPSRTLTIPIVGPAPLTAISPTLPMASPFSVLIPPPPPSIKMPENVSVPTPNVSPLALSSASDLALKSHTLLANPVSQPIQVQDQKFPPEIPMSAPAPGQECAKADSLPTHAQNLRQVVAEVTMLIEQTRQTLDQLFSEMVGQLKTALTSPTALIAPPQAATASNNAAKVENLMLPPATAEIVPHAKEFLPENPPNPCPTPVKFEISPSRSAPEATAGGVDPVKAAELNGMLSRAFAQRQAAPPASQPEPAFSPATPQPADSKMGERPLPRPPQTPFEMVAQLDSPMDTPMAAFPFPPLPEDSNTPMGIFGGIPPLPSTWAENEDTGHSAPFTFLSKPSEMPPQPPTPSSNWSLPPLKHAPPPPTNWQAPDGKI